MSRLNATLAYWNLCCAEQWKGGVYRSVEIRDDSLRLRDGAYDGAAFLPPLDSGETGFRWGRVKLAADIPGDSAIRIYARASDERNWQDWEALQTRPEAPGAAQALFGDPVGLGEDVWLSQSGRYLWLAIAFTGGGTEKPSLNCVSILADSDHMIDYLPAVYQEQDFAYRYLSVFTAMAQDMEERISGVRRQLDPACADSAMLRDMARWLCVDRAETDDALREWLPRAMDEYETMYTVRGIQRSVRRMTGQTPFIVEHFAVDPNDPECSNPELYRRLYGDDPYRFFLLLPQSTFSEQKQMEQFLEQLEELVPAETEPELVLLKPCVQLDWHTYLGVNSQIGDYVTAVIDESVTIHYDTTIGGDDNER
ncbi:MAG: hypothetical protein IJU66_04645 [Oscillospiraceae bacterium]|nr:hypothetical protein [Oscillospiraceae bacterium]